MYHRILVALDPQGLAERALPVVIALARRSLAEVVLVSICDDRDAEQARAAASVVARLEREGVRARAEVRPARTGGVSAPIIEAARRLPADLVALGSHGRGDLAGLLLGSVGHEVAAHLDCPILLVHDGRHEAVPSPLRRLLVAVDDSDEAVDAVEATAHLAREHDSAVLVVHALQGNVVDHDGSDAARDAAAALLDHASRHLAAPGRPVESRLLPRGGPVATRLAAAAERWDTDLVVVGSRRLTDLGGLLLGSVAHGLVRHTRRPVLLAERRRAGRGR